MNKKGFTLIELLVVIAILGILSTIAVVSLQSAREKARDARRVSDIKQIQTALELYYNEGASYPADPADATILGAGNALVLSTAGWEASLSADETALIAQVPADPAITDADATECPDYAGYDYTQTESGGSYTIAYCLAGATGGIDAGAHTATPAGIDD